MFKQNLHKKSRLTNTRFARLPARLGALCLATLMIVSAPSEVDAATQGQLGFGTSTGSVDVDLIIGFQARINGFQDFALGDWSGTGPMTANDDICVGLNFLPATYRIRASGDGEPGDPSAFTLSNGATQINYNVFFNDAVGTAGRVPLTAGSTLTGQVAPTPFTNVFANPSVFNFFFGGVFGCAGPNANISIEVPEAELTGGFGTYNGTLTVTLLPE